MSCLTDNLLDDYFDGRLAEGEVVTVEAHAAGCSACRSRLAGELDLRERLARLPIPEPDMQRFERALERAAAEETTRRRWRSAGWALAASVLLMVAVSAYLPGRSPEQDIPGLTIALHEVREISLAVESPRRLDDTVFKVVLPEGIELAGYPGQREISWKGSLEPGKNLLVLPLKAETGTGGEIVTSISHVDRSKTYVLNMVVTPDGNVRPPPAAGSSARVVM